MLTEHFRARNRRMTVAARAWPWFAIRYRTRIARRVPRPLRSELAAGVPH